MLCSWSLFLSFRYETDILGVPRRSLTMCFHTKDYTLQKATVTFIVYVDKYLCIRIKIGH